jgi:small subunit ribosomal protein S20
LANHASALKAHRQSLKRRAVNRRNSSRLRSGLRKIRELIADGKAAEARTALPEIYELVDRSVQKRVLSPNAAARQKSRITQALNQLGPEAAAK